MRHHALVRPSLQTRRIEQPGLERNRETPSLETPSLDAPMLRHGAAPSLSHAAMIRDTCATTSHNTFSPSTNRVRTRPYSPLKSRRPGRRLGGGCGKTTSSFFLVLPPTPLLHYQQGCVCENNACGPTHYLINYDNTKLRTNLRSAARPWIPAAPNRRTHTYQPQPRGV